MAFNLHLSGSFESLFLVHLRLISKDFTENKLITKETEAKTKKHVE